MDYIRICLKKRVMNFTEFNFDVLKSICGTDILEYLNEVDEYELFINGLIRDKEKALNLASSLVIM